MNLPDNRLIKSVTIFLVAFLYSAGLYSQESEFIVLISTNMGNMKVRLYNDTPLHRDNFLKLADKKYFDGTLFYRVVKDFVIQGGSSDSRNAPAGKHIGYGEKPVNIDSEFRPGRFHKKGALCAPRQPQDINHFKMSDVSQFYIVKGRIFTETELDNLEKIRNNPIMVDLKKKYYLPNKEELERLKTTDGKAYNDLLRSIKDKINFEYSISRKLEFSEEQRKAYTTTGGCPDLDGDYTVFGEVIEGMDVIDKMASLPVDKNDRPLKDVTIRVSILFNK